LHHESSSEHYEVGLGEEELEKKNLKKSLTDAEEKLKRVKQQNEELVNKFKGVQEEILNYQKKLKRTGGSQVNVIDLYKKFRVEDYQEELFRKENELTDLKNTIDNKNSSLASVKVAQDYFQEESKRGLKSANSKEKVIKELEGEIRQLENQIDNLYIDRRVEGTALLELEHLRADNERLIGLLKENEKTKAFAEFFEDSGGAIGLPSEFTYGKMSNKKGIKQNWIPQGAYKLAQDTLHKNKGLLNEPKINALIAGLNQIWKERLRKQVTRIKQNYMTEIAKERKERTNGNHFSEEEAKKAISRLKTDVNCAYKELKDNKAIKEKEESPVKNKLKRSDVRLSNTLNGERRKLRNENAWLRSQIAKLQEVANVEGGERAQYLEGAAWIGNAMAKDIKKHVELVGRLCNSCKAKKSENQLEVHADLMKKIDNSIEEFKAKARALKNNIELRGRRVN
jgi:hypothetical protein